AAGGGSAGHDATTRRPSGPACPPPAVGGVAALLREAHRTWTPFDVIQSLRATASRFDDPDAQLGYGLARAADAADWTPSTVFANPVPGAAALVLAGSTPVVRGGRVAFWARAGATSGLAHVTVF